MAPNPYIDEDLQALAQQARRFRHGLRVALVVVRDRQLRMRTRLLDALDAAGAVAVEHAGVLGEREPRGRLDQRREIGILGAALDVVELGARQREIDPQLDERLYAPPPAADPRYRTGLQRLLAAEADRTPHSPLRLTCERSFAVRMSAFDGTQPVFRQSPPMRWRSMSVTLAFTAAAM